MDLPSSIILTIILMKWLSYFDTNHLPYLYTVHLFSVIFIIILYMYMFFFVFTDQISRTSNLYDKSERDWYENEEYPSWLANTSTHQVYSITRDPLFDSVHIRSLLSGKYCYNIYMYIPLSKGQFSSANHFVSCGDALEVHV